MRSKLSTAAAVVLSVDVATIMATGARELAIPIYMFNSLLAVGVVAGLSLLLPPLLTDVVTQAAADRASDDYLRGIRDGANDRRG